MLNFVLELAGVSETACNNFIPMGTLAHIIHWLFYYSNTDGRSML